jgi:hypothetical protein
MSGAERREALLVAAERSARPPHLLEKDTWVVWALRHLFTGAQAGHLVFKGGTSLSKPWGVIRRFSEDIDLTYDVRTIAPELIESGELVWPKTESQRRHAPLSEVTPPRYGRARCGRRRSVLRAAPFAAIRGSSMNTVPSPFRSARPSRPPRGLRMPCIALTAALAACGTQVEREVTSVAADSLSAAPAAASSPAVPMLADPGSEKAIASVLAAPRFARASPFVDTGAVTRLGLYASPEQAARVLAARPGAALRVKVDRGGSDEAELAVRIVWGEQAAADLPNAVPVFVTGPDLRLAATVVDRLQDGGLTRVFLVGPDAGQAGATGLAPRPGR